VFGVFFLAAFSERSHPASCILHPGPRHPSPVAPSRHVEALAKMEASGEGGSTSSTCSSAAPAKQKSRRGIRAPRRLLINVLVSAFQLFSFSY